MIILGVSHPISWNPAACLVIDGELVAMVEEERLNRVKHAPRMSPVLATEYCLQSAGITMRDVDVVAVGFGRPLDAALGHVRRVGLLRGWYGGLRWFYETAYHGRNIPGQREGRRIVFVNHHLAHAASTFFPSGFAQANILSLDGSGGSESGILAYGDGAGITTLELLSNHDSWGHLYELITGKLGFRRHSGEGKTMGLAPYGTPDPKGLPFIDWSGEIPRIDKDGRQRFIANLRERQSNEPLTQAHKDLAATLQHTLERAGLQMVEAMYRRTGSRRLCLAGGVALNCSMNGTLLRSPFVDEIFIQPAAHDGGTALGAALAVHTKLTGKRPRFRMEHAYWGPEYDNDQILPALKAAGITHLRRSDDICRDTARVLRAGKIVGWFQGRAEVGPRALGSRSILADPSIPDMKDRVNLQVKRRESWRPFAPSMLEEYTDQYVEHAAPSPFMILAFQACSDKLEAITSATHVDGSCRPQTVSRRIQPRYWGMIDAFRELSGIPVVLNTSFNIDSQPIVCSPADAAWTFLNCGLDYMAIGDYLVWKQETALPEEQAGER
jgi:carbamoyltransferase